MASFVVLIIFISLGSFYLYVKRKRDFKLGQESRENDINKEVISTIESASKAALGLNESVRRKLRDRYKY